MSKEQAAALLREAGAEFVKKEDRYGSTRSGWFVDDVFLGSDARQALRDLQGAG